MNSIHCCSASLLGSVFGTSILSSFCTHPRAQCLFGSHVIHRLLLISIVISMLISARRYIHYFHFIHILLHILAGDRRRHAVISSFRSLHLLRRCSVIFCSIHSRQYIRILFESFLLINLLSSFQMTITLVIISAGNILMVIAAASSPADSYEGLTPPEPSFYTACRTSSDIGGYTGQKPQVDVYDSE